MGGFFVLGDGVGGGESLQGGFRGEGTEQGVEFVRGILTDRRGRRGIRGKLGERREKGTRISKSIGHCERFDWGIPGSSRSGSNGSKTVEQHRRRTSRSQRNEEGIVQQKSEHAGARCEEERVRA